MQCFRYFWSSYSYRCFDDVNCRFGLFPHRREVVHRDSPRGLAENWRFQSQSQVSCTSHHDPSCMLTFGSRLFINFLFLFPNEPGITCCRDFALPGSYRHLVVKPEDVHYEIHEYTDSQKPLVQSDYARMTANEPTFTEDGALSSSKNEGRIWNHLSPCMVYWGYKCWSSRLNLLHFKSPLFYCILLSLNSSWDTFGIY